jgi:hypothetical protein
MGQIRTSPSMHVMRAAQVCQPPQTMIPIPASVTATPAKSQAVGGTPSTYHSHSKANGELAVNILFKAPDGVVFVVVNNEPLVRRYREKRQHVAARERGDKRGLGIDALWIAQIRGRGGTGHLNAVVEPPDMIATVILIAEVGAVTRPFDVGLVLRHGDLCRVGATMFVSYAPSSLAHEAQ